MTLHPTDPYKGIIKLVLCDWSALHRDWTGGTQLHIIFPLSTICMNSKKYAAQVSLIGQKSAPALVAIYDWKAHCLGAKQRHCHTLKGTICGEILTLSLRLAGGSHSAQD